MTWYNTNWKYRKKITIDNTKVSASLTDYPIYLDLSELGTDFFDNVKSDGGDIRITKADEETEVPREVVSCDTTAETGEVHFKGDLSSSTDTDFYVYYGNSGASDYAITATYGAENVWNSNYKAVYHLQNADDSTSNSNDGTVTGATSGATGKIGDGYSFDGSNDYIHSIVGNLPNAYSISMWIKTTDSSVDFSGFSDAVPTDAIHEKEFYVDASGYAAFRAYDGTEVLINSNTIINDGNKHYIVITAIDNGFAKIYVDGVYKAQAAVATLYNGYTTAYFTLGIGSNSIGYLSGILDEARIHTIELSDNLISTEYNNQNSPSTFYTIGIQEESKISSNTIFLSNNF